ncbi:MAG: hypothetical protein Q4G51_17895 [Dermatophilus congolensis]|nr:hypothetical protein [Dermatophilus congolensis]
MSRFHSLLRALAITLAVLLAWTTAATTAQAAPAASGHALLARIQQLLPDDAAQRIAKINAELDVIDPTQYVCDGPSELDLWVADQVSALSEDDITFLMETGAMSIPAVDLSYFADPADPFYAPTVNAARLMRDFRDGMRFWTPTVPGTRFLAAHSYVVTDAERIAPSLGLMFDLPEAEAAEMAQLVAEYASTSPGLQHGKHPLLSFTAFATSPAIYPDRPTTVVLGDGMLQAYAEIGYADVAGRFILAHEVGHTVQIAAGEYDVLPTTPEENRRLELMADAMAGYFSAHPRGVSMQKKRVVAAAEVAYWIGDCSFEFLGHHGTPAQRARTAAWGAELATTTRPRAKVLTYAQFLAAFNAAYPTLIAPDAEAAA